MVTDCLPLAACAQPLARQAATLFTARVSPAQLIATMSEEDPLLSSLPRYNDPENPDGTDEPDKQQTWREWTAEMLESPPLHKTVIALARIPYAVSPFSSPTCSTIFRS